MSDDQVFKQQDALENNPIDDLQPTYMKTADSELQIPFRRSLSVGCREISEADYDSIVKQVEFYFSQHNLPYDVFMKNLIQESKNLDDSSLSGWIPLTTILTFNRMKKWRPIDRIATILREHSTKLEVSPEGDFIKPKNMEEIDFLMDSKRMKQFFNEQNSRSCVLSNFYLDKADENSAVDDEEDNVTAEGEEQQENKENKDEIAQDSKTPNSQSKNLEQVERYLHETFPQFDFKQIRLKYKHKKFSNNTLKLFANSVVLELNDEPGCNEFISFIGENKIMHNNHQLQCMSKRQHGFTRASTKRVDKKFQGKHKIAPKSDSKRRYSVSTSTTAPPSASTASTTTSTSTSV